ncbi:Maf family protein [Enterococcus sp. ALS3]|uniref:dTTP/UTP pyrophosphatase n=1 Tax=Enterococcus alishanensis TaxID=1303817 RepID=A0ABS6TFW3_9ENTE|nr:Maf family protein [Enterococcus alishanensis]MBV7391782.1 Maf family protein [Enterococcus alishanensis]
MIILASQSPRRQELLRWLVSDFSVQPADINEDVKDLYGPKEYVMKMAQEKAAAIAAEHPEDLVIACDTVVVADDIILGKPKDRIDAYKMLKMLSNRSHLVYTSVILRQGEQMAEKLTQAEVKFFPLTDGEIYRYLDTDDYIDKAGGYGIQHEAGVFVEKITGDYYAIVGFPVGEVNQMLKNFEV